MLQHQAMTICKHLTKIGFLIEKDLFEDCIHNTFWLYEEKYRKENRLQKAIMKNEVSKSGIAEPISSDKDTHYSFWF